MSQQDIPGMSEILERIPPGERTDGARALTPRSSKLVNKGDLCKTTICPTRWDCTSC